MQAIKFSAEDIDKPAISFKPEDIDGYDALEQTRRSQAAKYPTEEEGGAPLVKPWSLRTIVGTAASDLNPLNIIRPFSRPVETAEALGTARAHSEQKVGEAVNDYRTTGDKLAGAEAITRGALNMIPTVGPFLANAAEEAGTDPSAGAGHVLAAATGPKIYKAVGNLDLAAPKNFINKLRENGIRATVHDMVNESRGVTPELGLFKALRPRNFVRDADVRIKGAMPEINAGAELTKTPVTDLATMNEAVEAQITERLKQQKALIGDEKFAIKGKPIADAVWKSIPKLELLRMGEDAQAALHESIYNTWDRDFTPQELAEFVKDSNASRSVQGYFAKLPGQQIALNRVADAASAMAENRAIRQTLIDGLENYKGTGEGIKKVNGALRDLISTKDLIDRRYNVEVRQAVENLPQQVAKLAALGRYGAAAKALIAGEPGAAALNVFTGMGESGLANFIRELNSTNGQITSTFRRFKGAPDAVPINPVSRYNRALPPASSPTVLPSETGSASPGSLSSVSQWQRPGAIALKQGLREDPEVFMQTGVGETTDAMREVLAKPPLSNSTDLARRMRPNMFPASPATEVRAPIDAEIISSQPRVFEQPAAEGARPPLQIPEKSGGPPPGKRVTPMGPITQREFLNLSNAEYEIQRDPATGRFKKVYKGTAKEKK